jgi:hypothetical protein
MRAESVAEFSCSTWSCQFLTQVGSSSGVWSSGCGLSNTVAVGGFSLEKFCWLTFLHNSQSVTSQLISVLSALGKYLALKSELHIIPQCPHLNGFPLR